MLAPLTFLTSSSFSLASTVFFLIGVFCSFIKLTNSSRRTGLVLVEPWTWRRKAATWSSGNGCFGPARFALSVLTVPFASDDGATIPTLSEGTAAATAPMATFSLPFEADEVAVAACTAGMILGFETNVNGLRPNEASA